MTPDRTPWHALTPTEVGARLGCDPRGGLDEAEAARRLAAHGENALREPPRRPWWRTFLRQFRELVIGILLVAAGLSAALGDWADTAAIVAIVLVNALIGFLQEERAYRALAALERLAAPLARAVRAGSMRTVTARQLVPGDRILLEAGDRVPADGRLLEAYGLVVQEAPLTGESAAVEKGPVESLPAATPLGDRRSIVHAGTVVAAGRGAAVVVETGMETELGRIAGLLERVAPEPTTLERRLGELGRLLVVVCLAVVGLIFVVELWRGGGFVGLSREGLLGKVLLRSLSLAVAAVPEGLPAVVTLVLSLGLQRMVARGAIVRRLPSVETLGSVTVICSDKTGTLTRNEMTLREVVTAGGRCRATGVGYAPQGEFRRLGGDAEERVTVAAEPDLERLLVIGARCTNSSVRPGADGGDWEVVGDPTEGALVVAALKGGVAVDAREPVVYEIPFDSARKLMSVVARRRDGSRVLETKGATEAVLARCVAELRDGQPEPLTPARRAEILAAAAGLADRALRVLSLACRELPAGATPDSDPDRVERDLVHVGLAALLDPPRDEARVAVDRCRSAGIRPVMITGDHPATALAVGRELGLTDGGPAGGRVVTGVDVDALTDERLADEVAGIAIYARVSAEHKLRVVRAWQRHGAVVARTGDGVNDAPAVQAADIGIAMGVSGTDVTKEASDMVLTDDDFASIVSAIEEGRGIYDNIQKFMHYLLACNAGEVLLMLVAALLGWPPPLAAIQILWLNLVTDGLPALALGLEPAEPDIMTRPPRPPQAPVLTWGRGLTVLVHGAVVAAVCVAGFWWSWRGSDDPATIAHAQTVTFCVAAFAQLLFAIGCRSDRFTAFAIGFWQNPALLVAIVLSALLQMAVVMLQVTRPVFEVPRGLSSEWLVVIGLALVPVTLIELAKTMGDVSRFRRKSRARH
ncbi:MAG: cation-translocating P-type ATPase [Planctomycetia bacterium]